jgi:hypothetical protein
LWPQSEQPNYRNVPTKNYPGKARIIPLARKVQETPWDWIIQLFNRLGNDHLPIFDLDGDLFSDYFGLRGYSWRGQDCNDWITNIHPGRQYNPNDDVTNTLH